jgi:hypothetical protein
VPGPRKLLAYLWALSRGREPRHLGHNPAGAVMVLGLMAAVLGIGITGWMMTLDAFWGNDTVESLHTLLVDVTLVAVAVHVLANVLGSLRHRENLIAAMVTGDKPAQAACSASCASKRGRRCTDGCRAVTLKPRRTFRRPPGAACLMQQRADLRQMRLRATRRPASTRSGMASVSNRPTRRSSVGTRLKHAAATGAGLGQPGLHQVVGQGRGHLGQQARRAVDAARHR